MGTVSYTKRVPRTRRLGYHPGRHASPAERLFLTHLYTNNGLQVAGQHIVSGTHQEEEHFG